MGAILLIESFINLNITDCGNITFAHTNESHVPRYCGVCCEHNNTKDCERCPDEGDQQCYEPDLLLAVPLGDGHDSVRLLDHHGPGHLSVGSVIIVTSNLTSERRSTYKADSCS